MTRAPTVYLSPQASISVSETCAAEGTSWLRGRIPPLSARSASHPASIMTVSRSAFLSELAPISSHFDLVSSELLATMCRITACAGYSFLAVCDCGAGGRPPLDDAGTSMFAVTGTLEPAQPILRLSCDASTSTLSQVTGDQQDPKSGDNQRGHERAKAATTASLSHLLGRSTVETLEQPKHVQKKCVVVVVACSTPASPVFVSG